MMELDRTVVVGAGGLLAGFLLAYAIGASGRSALEAQLREQGEVIASVSALEARVAALDGKIDSSTAALTEQVTAAAASADDGGLQALAERVETLSGDLAARLEAVAPRVRESLSGDFEDMRGGLAALASRGEAAVGEALDAVAGREATAPVGDPAAATGEGVEVGVAQTAALGDGAVRVFLSSTDAAAGTAQVAVNGFRREAIALGGSLPAGDCTVVMTGLAERSATFDATCGAAAAEPAAAAAEAAPVAAGAAAGPGQTLSVGQTALFADGAVRVFLSAVDPEAGAARVSVNAAAPVAVAVGAPQAMGSCSVTLNAVAPGSATFVGSCGDAAAPAASAETPAAAGAAETAAQTPAAEGATETAAAAPGGSGAGSEVAVGDTVILADGKLRVFLSAFDAEAGTARVAINGVSVTPLTMSEVVTAGDCRVELTGGSGGTAIIDGGC